MLHIADVLEEENYPKIAEEVDARILPPTNAAVHYMHSFYKERITRPPKYKLMTLFVFYLG